MDKSNEQPKPLVSVPTTDGNPDGKGAHGFLDDWRITQPSGVVAKPQRQVLAALFTSMLVLSSSFKYRPIRGRSNYLYWIDGQWSLSLIAPHEWSPRRRRGFAGTCTLQSDMTWTIVPSVRLVDDSPVSAAIRRFFTAFAELLNTDLTFEEILPFYVGKLPYYQRLYASALSRSLSAAVTLGSQASISCQQWRKQLLNSENALLVSCGQGLLSRE
ncbi:MAG: DUF2452 domain-containing protein [Gammaproteobacteria bacterium]|jgi:hypothetical protein|nr:DUF2452 domain-containing protein [Gammaproteobacteria bacterium]